MAEPPPPPPPPPPPEQPGQPQPGPQQADTLPGGDPGGGGKSSRGKIIAGVAAAIVVLGGVGAAIALSGGSDDGGSTDGTVTDTTAVTDDTTGVTDDTTTAITDDTTTTDPGSGGGLTAAEQQLTKFIAPEYRNRCTQEDKDNQEPGATAALVCDAPRGFYLAIESFDNPSDFKSAFNGYADNFPATDNCAGSWDVSQTWFWNPDKDGGADIATGERVGGLLCFTNTKDLVGSNDGNSMFWTDDSRSAIAFMIGNGGTSKGEAFEAWQVVAQPPL